MSKKNRHNQNPQTDQYGQLEGMDGMNVVSDTEYTGMIPTPPGGCDDCESYSEIGDIPSQQPTIGDHPTEKSGKKHAR